MIARRRPYISADAAVVVDAADADTATTPTPATRKSHRGRPTGPYSRAIDPTPDEIEQRAAAIRVSWGRARLAHAQGLAADDIPAAPDTPTWTPPEFSSTLFDHQAIETLE